jgi:hypothetical protein
MNHTLTSVAVEVAVEGVVVGEGLLGCAMKRLSSDGTNEKTWGGKNDDVSWYIGWLCCSVKNQPLKLSNPSITQLPEAEPPLHPI